MPPDECLFALFKFSFRESSALVFINWAPLRAPAALRRTYALVRPLVQPLLAPDEAVDCLSAGYHGEPGLLAAVEEEVSACSHNLGSIRSIGKPYKVRGRSTPLNKRMQLLQERVQLLQLTKGLLVKRLLAAGYEDSEIRSMEREHDKARQRGLAVGQNTGAL